MGSVYRSHNGKFHTCLPAYLPRYKSSHVAACWGSSITRPEQNCAAPRSACLKAVAALCIIQGSPIGPHFIMASCAGHAHTQCCTLATLHTWSAGGCMQHFLVHSLHTSRLQAVHLHAKWRVQHFFVFLLFLFLRPRIQLPNKQQLSCSCLLWHNLA